jgi:membrane associated rhomboid family serine protease
MNNYFGRENTGGAMFPPVIKGIIIINVIFYVLQNVFGNYGIGNTNLGTYIYKYLALFPLSSDNFLMPEFYPWQLISYQFLHGSFSHILFNLLALWMLGRDIEYIWGGKKFLIYYLLCGIGAGLAQLFISPLLGSTGPTVGASGAIYGIMLAYALTYPNNSLIIFPIFIPIKAKYFILLMIAFDLFMGFGSADSVAHFAHLGGAAAGFLLFKFGDRINLYNFFRKKGGTQYQYTDFDYDRNRGYKEANVYQADWTTPKQNTKQEKNKYDNSSISPFSVNGEEINQIKVDEILDKISSTGYQNLSQREKDILFELSKKIR